MTGLYASAVIPTRLGVAALQQAQQAPAVQPPDSIIVESPLPGGVATLTRFLLSTVPQWVQLTGLVVAVIVAGLVVWYLVRRRAAIRAWLASRSRGVTVALVAGMRTAL